MKTEEQYVEAHKDDALALAKAILADVKILTDSHDTLVDQLEKKVEKREGENHGLRKERRELRQKVGNLETELETAKGLVPEGSVVVTKADSEALLKYKALGTLEEVGKGLKKAATASAEHTATPSHVGKIQRNYTLL